MSILEILKAMVPVEVIDGSNVEEVAAQSVMLDVEFTPVLPDPVDGYDDGRFVPTPCSVQMEGFRWCVWMRHSPEKYRWVDTDEELKVMRARYLLLRGFYYRTIENMSHSHRQEVISKFFPGGVFKPNILINK